MILIGGVLVVTFAFIAFELFHKSLAALAGAIVAVIIALFMGIFPGESPYEQVHHFIAHDLNVIGVIVGTSILVGIAGRSGLFHFIAIKLVKATGGKPALLLPTVLAATIGFVTILPPVPSPMHSPRNSAPKSIPDPGAPSSPDVLPFQHILDRCRETKSGLIIVPAPYREDFAEFGAASIGSNLDLLLARRETPLLVVRDPSRDAAAALREIVIPLSFLARDDVRAAAWALRIGAGKGSLHILAIASNEPREGAEDMVSGALDLKDLDEAALTGLGQPEMAGLIAAVQRRAAQENIGCRVSVRVGPAVETAVKFAGERNAVIVTACPRDDRTEAWSRTQVPASSCIVAIKTGSDRASRQDASSAAARQR